MKVKRILHKAFYLFGALFLSLLFIFQTAINPAKAESSVQDFRKTDILDDLSDVEISLYPALSLGKPQIIRCQEYCYSEKPFFAEYYTLMIYVYNPTETELNLTARNTVNMAVTYDEKGKPSAWAKVPLSYCDKTDNNRFYKFEVDYSGLLAMALNYSNAHEGVRRYDFADIEFVSKDGKTIASSAYSKTYYYEGFSAGCGATANSESTLKCQVEGLETVELNVKHTNYRTEQYDINNVCDELNTAYFSVGEKYFDNYGNLQKIRAEWYEYKTNPIFVTSDNDAYNALEDYIGVDIGEQCDDLNWAVYWGNIVVTANFSLAEYAYNYKLFGGYDGNTKISRIDWLFNRENVSSRDDYDISATEIEAYMDWYTSKFGGSLLNGYSETLFTDSVDEGRIRGYNNMEIDAGDTQNLAIYDKNQSWWNKLWHGTKFSDLGYSPIVTFSNSDLSTVKAMTAGEFGETYLVNETDCATVRQYVISELESGNRPVLFRFAQTDYYASTAYFDKHGVFMSQKDGYVAQMTQFLDFDIISLTFRSEKGEDTVIGVCATPIDIINGTDAPEGLGDDMDLLDWLLLAVIGIIAVGIVGIIITILWPILWPLIVAVCKGLVKWIAKGIAFVFKLLWLIITLPFVLIGKLFKRKN